MLTLTVLRLVQWLACQNRQIQMSYILASPVGKLPYFLAALKLTFAPVFWIMFLIFSLLMFMIPCFLHPHAEQDSGEVRLLVFICDVLDFLCPCLFGILLPH